MNRQSYRTQSVRVEAVLAALVTLAAAGFWVISAFRLWPITFAYGPLCGETRAQALLHCPACLAAIGLSALAAALIVHLSRRVTTSAVRP